MATNYSSIYLLSFNNYYNRILKRFETIQEYADYLAYEPLYNYNFNPGDGIDTEITINTNYLTSTPAADYVVVVDSNTSKISGRWYIINANRLRGGQYKISLHRDLLADYRPEVMNADVFVERGFVNAGNPLIFNSEGMNFNQIKKSEILLKDETESGWFVGYMAANAPDITFDVVTPDANTYPPSPISTEELNSLANSSLISTPQDFDIMANGCLGANRSRSRWLTVNTTGIVKLREDRIERQDTNYSFNMDYTAQQCGQWFSNGLVENRNNVIDTTRKQLAADIGARMLTSDEINQLISMNNNTYYDASNNKTFTVRFKQIGSGGSLYHANYPTAGDFYNTICQIAIGYCGMYSAPSSTSNVDVSVGYASNYTQYELLIEDTIQNLGTVHIPTTTIGLMDAPYKMFCIPAGDVKIESSVNKEYINSSEFYNKILVSSLIKNLGGTASSNYIYDMQYLPYCPFKGGILSENKITITDKSLSLMVNKELVTLGKVVEGGREDYSFMLFCNISSFSLNINKRIDFPADPIQFKLDHETKFCRICSPNYSSSFEFRPTSNYGVEYFEVNCTYKPYQPFIHVNPKFSSNGLYGSDFNDNRGLVCSGDFSLPSVTDAWKQYQINNAAYQDSFDRRIENMEETYSIQRDRQKTQAAIGVATAALSGAVGGGVAGANVGGPVGGAVGGVVAGVAGTAASVYGMRKDLEYADSLQREALSYAQDQFNYSLQNIKALPYSLGKVSSFTINNKVFPFVEFYSASDEEINALRNRIEFRGMTIGVIGKIPNYLGLSRSFIQGSLIRIEGIEEDYHTAAAIAAELHKGVYIE